MNVVVAMEHHFRRTPGGEIWSPTIFSHTYLRRYLAVFEQVRIVARVEDAVSPAERWVRSDGPGVSILPLPDYYGPVQYIKKLRQLRKRAQQAVRPEDAVILDNGQIGLLLTSYLHHHRHPYGMYVVGDPQEMFQYGAVRHPLSPFFRWWSPQRLRRQCANACAVAYVSKIRLPERYPGAPGVFTTHFAIDGLKTEEYVEAPRPEQPGKRNWNILYVGTLAQLYKAPDILINAVNQCIRAGLDLKLTLVGDGKHRRELEERVAAYGLKAHVRFLGWLPGGDAVLAQMDQSDLFVLPSRAEALGQVFVEAMARGLPCIGTTSGGIPELLDPADMVPPGDPAALAHKIIEVLNDPARMARMSARNLRKAREYSEEAISKRRNAFYREVRTRTEEWIRMNEHCKRKAVASRG